MESVRSQTAKELTRRWVILLVGTGFGKAVLLLSYALGSFALASLARSREDPTIALASLFLLAAIAGFGWLTATYLQEIADSIQEFHADALDAFANLATPADGDDRTGTADVFRSKAAGFLDAARAGGVNVAAVVGALLVRALIALVPPFVGWMMPLF